MVRLKKSIFKRGTCGFTVFRYFGNFDFNVRYYGFIQPCGMRFFILLANGIR